MRKTVLATGLAAALAVFGTAAVASVNDDQVTSQKIKEADGTSGQNTNSGSGVKTGHIQDGAVTDAKISGPISASKIAGGTFQTKNANVVIVATSGGDFTSPINALSSITDASASNRYLVKVMPGVYDLGTTPLQMKDYVDLEGSGDTSVITSQVVNETSDDCYNGTINMANNSTVRNIRITNTGNAGVYGMSVSVVFQGVKAGLESASVVNTSSIDEEWSHSTAVCAQRSADVTLKNVYLEAVGQNYAWGHTVVLNSGTTMNINNATILAASASSTRPIDCNAHGSEGDPGTSNLVITNSYLESTDNTGQIVDMIIADVCSGVEIVNTKLVFNSSASENGLVRGYAGSNPAEFKVLNSQIINKAGTFVINTSGVPTRIANTVIPGGLTGQNNDLTNARIVNCYDENFLQITNRQ